MSTLLVLALAACDPDKIADDAAVDSGDSSDVWNRNAGGDDDPEVLDGEVWCTEGSNSSGDLFFVQVDVRDEQGEDTLSSQDSRIIARSSTGNEVFDESMLFCQDSGRCEGSWRSGDYGGSILCATGEDFTYHAVIVDYDGNESPEFDLTWTD